jgi:dimethylargininase
MADDIPVALTRPVSPKLAECEITHLERSPINIEKAVEQHYMYEDALREMGYNIRQLPETPDLPDGVFVEDTAVVFPEAGLITRPGAISRREETKTMAEILKEYRELKFIEAPGTVDGGDVLVIGRNVWIGRSSRTNEEGIRQFRNHLEPLGYTVKDIPVSGCLHLKTGIAVLEDDLLFINPEWIDKTCFSGFGFESVDPGEPYGANVMRRGSLALCPSSFPKTADKLQKFGYDLIIIDQSEMAKAEAGLTCCSVIIDV